MKEFKNFKIKGNDKQVKRYIQDLCAQIVRVADPQKIILFGSYAYGTPDADSDLDVLVIKSFTGHPWDQAAKLRLQLETDMPLDLLVRTPEYVAHRISIGDSFMQEITTRGAVLYEADYAGMDRQSGGRLVKREREVRARKNPNYDAACFHTQQCAEKYLKGRLEEDGIAFPTAVSA